MKIEKKESFIVEAPTRVDLAGGTLDLWPIYCLVGGGRTINLAIDLKAKAKFQVTPNSSLKVEIKIPGEEPFVFFEPISLDALQAAPLKFRFPAAIISRYLLQKPEWPQIHLQLELETEAPMKSGLGGSSSLCVAIAKGLARIFKDYEGINWKWELLDWVKDLEASFIKAPTGLQDYLAALFGGLNCFEFQIGKNSQRSYAQSVFQELSEKLVVLFSGEMHESGLSNWDVYKKAIEGDSTVLSGLKLIQDVAEEVDLELQNEKVNWMRLGGLLTQEWEMRKNLLKVSTPRLEEIENFLLGQKVLGFKVCGAASGGSFLVLCESSEKNHFIESCEKKGIVVLKTKPAHQGVSFY